MSDQRKYIDKLKDSRVLIIGGSAGIGYAVAEAVLEHGGTVIISSSNPSRISQAITSLQTSYPSCKDRISGYPCDLSLEANILSLLPQATPLDHIIFTAGNPVPPLRHSRLHPFRCYIALHSSYTPRETQPEISQSQRRLQHHVNNRYRLPTPPPELDGSRAAVIALAKNLALDLKPVRVNVVCVGAVDTETWDAVKGEEREILVGKMTTGRIGRPQDVAEAFVYCLRDGNVTGSVVVTDGGALLV